MWQSRPVFISSTFADMQAERDYLRTRVFPELEERLRARRHNLEWVDLRVGVATASQRDEHVRELYVLKVCLDEVRRCRPFLIVLLGDRYGWVPPEERIKAAAEEAREGLSANVAGRSVTDLEIEFGVLSDPEQQPRSFFYFRAPLPYAQMPAEIAALYCEDYAVDAAKAERKERLTALKRRIETRLPGRMVPYRVAWDSERQQVTGLEDFGRMVLEDIWPELEAETESSAADIPWQQSERKALEDFIDDRARDFVGRQDILDSLTGLVTGAENPRTAWGACVTGDPGSGKSALFGALYRRLHDGDVFLLAHAAGASINAAAVDSMLRRWIGEIADALGTDPGLPEDADPDTVDATFARLLGQMAQRRRVIVLVDALDQFENTTRGRHLTWLPRLWPANARLVATAIAGDASKALAERPSIKALSLLPLTAAEARDIIGGMSDGICKGICGRYHRALEPEVIEVLLAKRGPDGPAWGNPLWLVIAVEELNLLDADDFARVQLDYAGAPAERLRDLMVDEVADFPSDIPRLYEHTFERAEKLFGERLARGFLGLIAVGRAGWRESDFRILLPRASGENWDELKFAQLRRIFRGQLRQRGALAQWDFNHAQMRAAARARLAAFDVSEQRLHTIITDRLLSCPKDDPLHISETMVHLLASGDYKRARGYYGDSSLSKAEVQGATDVLADSVISPPTGTSVDAARSLCHLLDSTDILSCDSVAELFLFDLDGAIKEAAALDARLILFESAKRALEQLLHSDRDFPPWQYLLSVAHEKIGDATKAQGDLAGALKSYGASLAIREQLARSEPGNAGWQRHLSVSYNKVGGIQEEQGDLAGALKSYRDSLAIRERPGLPSPDDPQWLYDIGICYERIGGALMSRGDSTGALKLYLAKRDNIERLAQSDPGNTLWQRDLAVAFDRIGEVQEAQGDLASALNSYRKSFSISERLAQSDPANAGWQRGLSGANERIGAVYFAQGNLQAAMQQYQASLKRMIPIRDADLSNSELQRFTSVTMSLVAKVLVAQGDLAGAIKSYRDSLAIRERLTRADPGNTQWQLDLGISHENVGGVQLTQGDLTAALRSFEAKQKIISRLVNMNPLNMEWQRDRSVAYEKIGSTLLAQHDLGGAAKAFRESLIIRQRLTEADTNNMRWRHDLSISHAKLGDVLAEQGDLAGALKAYRESYSTLKVLTKVEPNNANWQRDLAVVYKEIGDLLVAQGDLEGALQPFRESFSIAERLAKADPNNVVWQRDLSVYNERFANIYFQQGNTAAALEQYRASLGRMNPIRDANPGNLDLLHFTSVTLFNIGEVQIAQRDFVGALKSYQDCCASFDRLASCEPNNASWQHDLSHAWDRLADVQRTQGDLSSTLKSHRYALAIVERLARSAPDNAQSQRDLSVSFNKVGDVQLAQGDVSGALKSYRDSLAIRESLTRADTSNLGWQRDLSVSYDRIGDVQVAQGDFAGALKSYHDSLAIRARVAQSDPGTATWQRHIAVSHAKVASVLEKTGEKGKAIDALSQGRAIIAHLTKSLPTNASWNQELSWFDSKIARLRSPS